MLHGPTILVARLTDEPCEERETGQASCGGTIVQHEERVMCRRTDPGMCRHPPVYINVLGSDRFSDNCLGLFLFAIFVLGQDLVPPGPTRPCRLRWASCVSLGRGPGVRRTITIRALSSRTRLAGWAVGVSHARGCPSDGRRNRRRVGAPRSMPVGEASGMYAWVG